MTRAGVMGTLLWVVLVAVAATIVARAHYTTDLSAFLPRSPTANQRLLVEQLKDGLASRLIIVAIEGSDSATRARLSRAMADQLRGDTQFVSVNNGESSGMDRDRAFLFEHRYLLSASVTPERITVDGLKDAFLVSIDLLASPAGLLAKELLPRDPTGEMVQIVGLLASGGTPRVADGVWASGDGKRALLVAQTRATGSDTDGQQRAVESVRAAFAAAATATPGSQAPPTGSHTAAADSGAPAAVQRKAPPKPASAPSAQPRSAPVLLMSGPGVFAVNARANIIKEVTRLSILSTAIVVALLLGVYRSVAALILGLVSVFSGALAGVAAVALGAGVVHGITLGFGITLIGEAVDYSIYLFIQSQQRNSTLWSTIRLGVLTSIVGFMSLLPSGFPGLQQLGLFSISGLVVAALVTRYVLPHLMPPKLNIADVTPLGNGVAAALKRIRIPKPLFLAVPVLAAVVLYAHRGPIWNHELSALSPVSPADQAKNTKQHTDKNTPDVSYLVVVSGPSQEAVLHAAEAIDPALDTLVEQKVIAGFESPARYLPSLQAQRERQASIPQAQDLKSALVRALEGLPIQAGRLEPFLHDAEAARIQPLMTRKDLEGTSLATGVDAL